MAFFHVATDIDQLRELDKWIRKMLYDHIYNEFRLRIDRSQLKKLLKKSGLKSLVNEKYQVRGSKTQPCLCDIRKQNQDIWIYASGLYQGKSFETLVQKRPFTIPYVDENGLQISVGKRQYKLKKDVLQQLWERLIKGERILRADLEKVGIRNTSHIVALLAELPGISITYPPITLIYKEKPPADFLVTKKI